MKKPSKNGKLTCVRLLLTNELLKFLQEEATKESRKLSPMLRRMVEEKYQQRKAEPRQKPKHTINENA